MQFLVEFLSHVLASEGYYCWWYKDKTGRPQQGFTSTIEQLAAALVQIDALGCDGYFACSTYKEPNKRTQENIKLAGSLWLDIDYGTIGHSGTSRYPDLHSAVTAVDEFCDKVELPYPTVVHTGGGLHVYWQLEQELPPDLWLAQANILKRLCREHGLDVDPSRTTDGASILRPPGTYNYKIKDTPRPVTCDELMDGTVSFAGATEPQPRAYAAANYGTGAQAVAHNAAASDLTKNITAIYGQREPSYASVAVSQCNQLRHFRDARGNIPEPLWYAGLGLLAECEDGYRLAHEWSAGHPSYTVEETDRKFNQAKTAAGATTCERFKLLNPASCAGCPFTITSPIVLGRQAAKPVDPQTPAAPIVEQTENWPPLPPGYGMNQKYELTIEVKRTDDKGVESKWMVPFTNHPIYLSQVRDGETERNQGLFFRQWEKHKGWVEFEITSQNFASMGTWGELAKHGCFMRNDLSKKHFAKYVSDSYQILKEGAYSMRYDQFGWKNSFQNFYYGGRLYKNNGTFEPAAGSQECTKRGDKMKPSKQGSLAGWSAAANKLFVDGCEAQSFALLASFASPLMAFITPPGEGGAVLSLVSPTGGTGKSTALTAVASVWGELEAIRLISRDTMTSKFRIIAILNSMPVVFDELRDRHPEIIVEFMQSFTTGRDRNRARVDGSINPIEMGWCNICVSASNKSLVDAINSAEKASTDAMADRVFEVEMRKPKDAIFSHNGSIGNELIFNRGHAGHAYISYLTQPGIIEWATKAMLTLVDHYIEVTGAQTSHRYMIRQVAAVAVAGQICKHLGLMEFSNPRIIDWAIESVKDRVKNTPQFEPWQTLVKLIDEHAVSSCVIVNRPFHPRVQSELVRLPRFDTHMRYEIEGKKLYIAADWIRLKLNEMNQPSLMVMKDLEDKGILLQRNRRTSLNAGLDLPGGKVPCWEIDMTHQLLSEVYIKEVLPTAVKIA